MLLGMVVERDDEYLLKYNKVHGPRLCGASVYACFPRDSGETGEREKERPLQQGVLTAIWSIPLSKIMPLVHCICICSSHTHGPSENAR